MFFGNARPDLVARSGVLALYHRNEVYKYGDAVAHWIARRNVHDFSDMKPLRTFKFSCFAMVNENGNRSVCNKSGAVAGVSGVALHV